MSNKRDFASVYVFATGDSNAEPEKERSGFNPTAAFAFLNCDSVRKVSGSMSNSSMSSTLKSNMRAMVRACGRFLEWLA